jgi:hypothetical protein
MHEKGGERSGIKDIGDGTHETRAARELELIDSHAAPRRIARSLKTGLARTAPSSAHQNHS